MLTPDQIAARRYFIGSSEAAASCGISPYKSRLQLWLEKTGRVPREDLTNNPRVHFGNILEPVVAQEYARRHPEIAASLQRNSETVYDGFRASTIDYRVGGRILECKTAGAWTSHQWRDAVPTDYRIQVEHQLMTHREEDAVLAVLIGGNDFREYDITGNPQLREMLHVKQAEFMVYLETDTPPPVESAADVLALFPSPERRLMTADDRLRADVARRALLADLARATEKEIADVEDRIALAMRDATDLIDAGRTIATLRAPMTPSTDWRSVAAELSQHVAGAVWDRTVRKHSHARKRTLRIQPAD